MPANLQRPTGNQFAEFLNDKLGRDYTVSYVERRDHRGQVDPTTSFFHITHRQGSSFLSTNLKINLGSPSHFETDYGGRLPRGSEYAPEVLTRKGTSGYVVGSTWESTYVPSTLQKGQRRSVNDPYNVQHMLRSPTESLATVIMTGFQSAREDISRGSRGVDVQSKIINVLAEGSGEQADFSVPGGSLLMTNADRLATRRAAAQSIQLTDVYHQSANVPELEQRSRIAAARYRSIETEDVLPTSEGPSLISRLFRRLGYGQDRDKASRFVPYAQGWRQVNDPVTGVSSSEIYLPTQKVAKHRTILDTGRQLVDLLGEDLQEISATPIPSRGAPVGFRQTTADVGGRIPERSLILGTLFSSQFPVPGAGAYFPQTTGLNIRTAGYLKESSFPITESIGDLLAGRVDLQLAQRAGSQIPSWSKWTYARMKTPDSEDYIPLSERMGAHTFAVGSQQLRMPRYYNRTTGFGEAYDERRLSAGELREVTQAEATALGRRIGAPIALDETVSRAFLEMAGYSQTGAKVAISGVKSDIVPFEGTPSIRAGGAQLPLSMLTWESKSMPETFLTSLGALSAQRQNRLLASYERSLGVAAAGTGDNAEIERLLTLQESVGAVRRELLDERRTDPSARLNIDRMAALANTPAHEIGKDIFQRMFLGGRTTAEFSQISEQELQAFAQSPGNIRNLSRYGMGYVSGEMSEPITTFWDESQVRALRRAYISAATSQEGAASLGLGAPISARAARQRFYSETGFDPKNVVQGRRAMTIRPQGFYMPVVAGPAVEFSGGGPLSAEDIMLVNRISPEMASKLGVSLQDITSAGAMSRPENIRNPVRWAQSQTAAIAMINAARGTDAILLPEANTIDERTAMAMLADPEIIRTLGKGSANLAGMKKFQELYRGYFPNVPEGEILSRPVQFSPAIGSYIPSPRAVEMLTTEDTATITSGKETGEDVTRTWDMYQQAFYQGLLGSSRQDVGTVTQGTGRLTSYFMNMFGLPGGDKRNVVKTLLGSDVGAIKSRYAFWGELGQNEIYGSRELYESAIRRELTQQGFEPTPEDVAQAYQMIGGKRSRLGNVPDYVYTHGVPGLAMRYPQTAGQESMAGVNYITAEHMLRRGRNIPADKASGLSNLHWRMGIPLSTIFQGDFDLDMMMGLLGIQGKRGKRGQLAGISFAGFDDRGRVHESLARNIQAMANMPYTKMQAKLFPAMSQRRQFDPLYQGLVDRGVGGMRSVSQSLIGQQFAKAGFYQYDVLRDTLLEYAGAKLQMGVTYDFTRALEASSEVGGWTTGEIMKGRTSRASLYQPFLDVASGVPSPLVNMYQTSVLSEGAGGKLGMTWGLPVGKVGERVQFFPQGATQAELRPDNAERLVWALAGTAASPVTRKGVDELPTPGALAWAFSPEGSRAFSEGEDAESLYQAMVQSRMSNADDAEALEQQYYGATSLEGAIRRPWGEEGVDVMQKSRNISRTITEWTMANYRNKPEQIFKAPLLQAMFSKAYAKKQRDYPGWEPPSSFLQTGAGQGLIERAGLMQPLFNMMRGRLSPGDAALRFMRTMQQRPGALGQLTNWGLGTFQNLLGFGKARMSREMNSLYSEAMSGAIQVRAGNLPGLLGIPPFYRSQTVAGTVPAKDFGQQALRTAGAYILGRTLGIPGSRTYDFTGAMFPAGDAEGRFEAGNKLEAMLGQTMGQEQGWYSVNRSQINPITGILEPREESDPTKRFQGAFVWSGELDNEMVEVGATPDFLRLYQGPGGEIHTMAVEQKSPTAGKSKKDIYKSMPGWDVQAKVAPWIVNQLREEIRAGGTTGKLAEESLRSTLASYMPNQKMQDIAYQSIMERGLESQVFVTQVGSGIASEIEKGSAADPQRIAAALEKQGRPGYWSKDFEALYQPSLTGSDTTMRKMTQYIGTAARRIAGARPDVFKQLWQLVEAAPSYWQQRRDVLRRQGKSTAGATAALDLMQQVRLQMKAIGKGALADIASSTAAPNINVSAYQSVAQFAEQQYGPAMRSYYEALPTQVTRQELEEEILLRQQEIARSAMAGERRTFAIPPGMNPDILSGAVSRMAELAGFQTDIQLEDEETLSAGFIPAGQAPPAPAGGGTNVGAPPPPTSGGGGAPPVPPSSGTPIQPPTAPPPPPLSGPSYVEATARAAEFNKLYEQQGPAIKRQAQALRRALSVRLGSQVGPLGVGAALTQFTPEEIKAEFSQFAQIGEVAHKLTSLGMKIDPNKIDLTGLPANIGARAQEATLTSSALGRGSTDLMSLFEFAFKKDKPGKPILDPSVLEEHMTRLGETFKRVNDAFTSLGTSTKMTGEQEVELSAAIQERKKAMQEFKVSEVAAPLVEAGILEKAQGIGQYRQIAQPITQEQIKQLETYRGEAIDMMAGAAGGTGGAVGGADTGNGLQRLLRRTLGGFGVMYMRSLWNIMTGGLGYGQQEALGFQEQASALGVTAAGVGRVPYNQMQVVENLRAIGGTAINPLLQLQQVQARSPMAQGITTGLGAGVGTYAFLQQMSMWGGSGSIFEKLASSKIGGISGTTAIAGGVALGALLLQAIGESQNPEATGYQQSFREGWSGQWNAKAVNALFSTGTIASLLNPEVNVVASEYAGLREQIAQGGIGPQLFTGSAEEKSTTLQRTLRELVSRFPQYSQEALSKALSLVYAGGTQVTPEMIASIAGQEQLGLGTAYYGATMGAFGWTPAQMQAPQGGAPSYMMQQLLSHRQAIPELQRQTILQGAALMQTMPEAYYFPGLGPGGGTYDQDYAEKVLEQWGEVPAIAQPLAKQLAATWYTNAQLGRTTPVPDVSQFEKYTPEELFRSELSALRAAQEPEYTKSLSELLATKFADVIGSTDLAPMIAQGFMAGATTPEQQAGVLTRFQTQAGINQFRSDRFGINVSQDYYQRLAGMTQPELDIETERQQIIDAVQSAMLGQGAPLSLAQAKSAQLQGVWDINAVRSQGAIYSAADELSRGIATAWGTDRYAGFMQLSGMGERLRNPYIQDIYSGMEKFQPYALTQAYAYGMNIPGGGNVQDWMVGRDIWGPTAPEFLQGQPLNAAPFTVSGASHPLWNMLAANVGGGVNWNTGVGKAFSQGYTIPGTNTTAAGFMGAQNYMNIQSAQASLAMAGINAQQLALTMEYTPQFWGIQDKMTQLGYQQAQWGFQHQYQGLELQQQQFSQNMAFQQQQAMTQRGWTRDDWAFQNETRQMQWGWRVEDFQENLRFMTGRDRRLAERQMGRETILKGREDEQIDTQRQRQEELWALEDERFEMQKQQFMENQKFQEEAIKKQQEFYEERFKLDKELTELQREYTEKQWELQKAAIGIQAQQAADALEYAKIQAANSLTMLEQAGLVEQIQYNGASFVGLLDAKLREWITALGGTPLDSAGDTGDGKSSGKPPYGKSAWGNAIWSGDSTWVGETGPEVVTLTGSGLYSQKRGEITPTLYSPWNTSTLPRGSSSGEKTQTIIVVNVGNEELKRFVVDTVGEEM